MACTCVAPTTLIRGCGCKPGLLTALAAMCRSNCMALTRCSCSQVALMFLTRGVLHHEAAWALWFAHARGLLPKTLIRARGCEPGLLQALAAACGAAASPRLLQQQHLFSVYVHIGANDAEFVGAPALFHNSIQKRYIQLLQQ